MRLMRKNHAIAHRRYGSSLPGKCSAPTDALPGSEAKIQVLMKRAARREELHVSGDLIDDNAVRLVYDQMSRHSFKRPTGAVTATVLDEPRKQKRLKRSVSDFSVSLHRLRGEMTFKALANRSGVSVRHLQQLEQGTRSPTLHVLVYIADALKVSLDVLVGRAR